MSSIHNRDSRTVWRLAGAIAAAVAIEVNGGDPPTFDSGSTGVDGALIIETPGTYLFDPTDPATFDPDGREPERLRLDLERDNVFHFTEIRIGAGVTVKLSAVPLGAKPVVWLASGTITVDGSIDLIGSEGHRFDEAARPSVAGAGGYSGGVGGGGIRPVIFTPGEGPGAGGIGTPDLDRREILPGGGAGHATDGTDYAGNGYPFGVRGKRYGNSFLLPLLGGSGGGGGLTGFDGSIPGGAGAGGGAILLVSSISISIGVQGGIVANGGKSGLTISCNSCGQRHLFGGGSGGAIRLVSPLISGGGRLTALGGGTRENQIAYGAVGRIRLEAFDHRFIGTVNPPPALSTPGLLLPPSPQPKLRLVRIAAADTPARTVGDVLRPDLTINASGASTLDIEAENVPEGVTVQVHMWSENGPGGVIESTPLVLGAGGKLTATATATIPPGVSRFFVQALWTP